MNDTAAWDGQFSQISSAWAHSYEQPTIQQLARYVGKATPLALSISTSVADQYPATKSPWTAQLAYAPVYPSGLPGLAAALDLTSQPLIAACRIKYGIGASTVYANFDFSPGVYCVPCSENVEVSVLLASHANASAVTPTFYASLRPCEPFAGGKPTATGFYQIAAAGTATVLIPPNTYAFDVKAVLNAAPGTAANPVLTVREATNPAGSQWIVRDYVNNVYQPPGPAFVSGAIAPVASNITNSGTATAYVQATAWIEL